MTINPSGCALAESRLESPAKPWALSDPAVRAFAGVVGTDNFGPDPLELTETLELPTFKSDGGVRKVALDFVEGAAGGALPAKDDRGAVFP